MHDQSLFPFFRCVSLSHVLNLFYNLMLIINIYFWDTTLFLEKSLIRIVFPVWKTTNSSTI